MIRFLFLILMLCVALPAQGQTKKSSGKARVAPESPAKTQKATTEDGKPVLLLSNGTWTYDKSISKSVQSSTSNLLIEAAIVLQSGDVKPIARSKFYLLDEDAAVLMNQANFVSDSPSIKPLTMYLLSQGFESDQKKEPFIKATALIKEHTKYEIISDFSGKGQFSNVDNGKYFLFCLNKTGRNYLVWNLPINIEKDEVLVLDQNNTTE